MRKVDSWKACCHESGMAGLAGDVRRRAGFPVTRLAPTQQILPASAHRGREPPRPLWRGRDHRVDLGQARLEDQHEFYRTPEPGVSPACGRDRAAGQHALQTRSGIASAGGTVSDLSQFLPAPRQLALATPRVRSDPRDGNSQKMVAANARHGSRDDGSGVEVERRPDVSGATLAAILSG